MPSFSLLEFSKFAQREWGARESRGERGKAKGDQGKANHQKNTTTKRTHHRRRRRRPVCRCRAQVLPLPYDAGADISKGIDCHVCAKHTSYSWRKLLQHLRYKHKLKQSDAKGTPLHEMARVELRSQESSRRANAKKRKALQHEQPEDARQEQQRPALRKPCAWRQMQVWAQCGPDGEPLMPLRCRMAKPLDVVGTDEEEKEGGQGMKRKSAGDCMRDSSSEDVDEEEEAKGQQEKASGECERGQSSKEPRRVRVSIAQQALRWTPDEGQTRPLRTKWPLAQRANFDTRDFEAYLRNTLGLSGSTVGAHAQKIKYFMGMLDVASTSDHIGTMVSLYRSGLMCKLLGLPIMRPEMPTTRNLLAAVEQFVDHLLLVCNRRNLQDASRYLSLLKAQDLRPLKKRLFKERSASNVRANLRDATRLESLPPMDVVQTACKEAMIDLHYIVMRGDAPLNQRRHAANVIMMGLIYTNSYAGRVFQAVICLGVR